MSHKTASIAIAAFFITVLLVLSALSAHGRAYAPAGLVMDAPEPHQALDLWRSQRMHGRVLILFGRLAANEPDGDAAPDDTSYVYHAIRLGIVREVFHVIPDSRWDTVAGRLASDEQFRGEGAAAFRGTIRGAPLVITRLSGLPTLNEPALVLIQGGYGSERETSQMLGAIKSTAISADMVVVTGEVSDSIMRGLQ